MPRLWSSLDTQSEDMGGDLGQQVGDTEPVTETMWVQDWMGPPYPEEDEDERRMSMGANADLGDFWDAEALDMEDRREKVASTKLLSLFLSPSQSP